MFPREAKFRYEFTRGKPWMHETLIAPFDFPIYKTQEEIDRERDSIIKSAKYYFSLDKSVFEEKSQEFTNYFDKKWDEYINAYYRINNTVKRKFIQNKLNKQKEAYYEFAFNTLKYVYDKGIIEITEEIKNLEKENRTVVLMNNTIADEFLISDVFTPQTAKDYIIKQVAEQKVYKDINDKTEVDFIKELKIQDFVVPNYFYDRELTGQFLKKALDNVSLTRGMVQEGERIISKGDVINDKNFKVLTSLKIEYESNIGITGKYYLVFLGQLIVVIALISMLYLFLYNFRKDIIQDNLKTTFILVTVLLNIFLARIVLEYSFLDVYIVPFAILPIIIRTFYDTRLALFIHLVTVLAIGFFVPNGFEFVFIQLMAGIMAIFSLASITRRSQLFLASFIVFITYSIVYFGISITQEADINKINYMKFAWFGGSSLLLLSSYPMIYAFEKIFGFLSDVTLMELSDTNHPILRELAEKTPGTFQHSLQVGNLAEECIRQIGGNPLLARTGALYHDIGKMEIPHYFIENQVHGRNPHDNLSYIESAQIIISHVIKGVEKAKKHRIPEMIIDFIKTHHGTSKVLFFYRNYIKENPDKEEDIERFTYPGPSPRTKEQAVVMMCDSVEAASRSLKEYTEKSINDLVEKIIGFQIEDDQFKFANVTFKDIATVKSILKKKLKNIYHTRIEYPEH
ncbi:MAG: HDIG domain-containing protein [Marinilabiliales bacterium]